MKKILVFIFSVLFVTNANAAIDALKTCLNKITTDNTWQSSVSGIFGDTDLDDTLVESHKTEVYTLLTDRFRELCGEQLVLIAKTTQSQHRGELDFKHKNKKYAFNFDINKIYDNIGIQTGILVINKRNLLPTSILKLSDIPKKQKFFSDECSDHTIFDNLDDDAAVNIAGQAVFNEFGGAQHEYFLDFAEGDNRRAFPGLVLIDKTGSTEETIVSYYNIKTGVEKAQQFAAKLKQSPCKNDRLSVYLVALNVQKTSDNRDTSASIVTGVAAAGAVTGTVSTTVAALGTIAASAAWVPVAGWVVAGVAGAAAATVALWPQKIADIQQVMILDGPYDL